MDLGYHVREMALASPGTDQQLADQVARIMSRPLDRARPLWELYVIEGHESGLIAVLTKIHHSVIDGLVRGRDHGAAARPHARGARGPAAGRRRPRRPVAERPAHARARRARAPPLSGADPALAAEGDPEPPGHAVRRVARNGDALEGGRAGEPRQPAASEPRRAEDEVQRPRLAAPAVRVRPALARRLQGGQERARRDRQRRRGLGLRGRGAALAARARRPAGRRRSSRRCRCPCARTRSSGPTATGSC